MVFVSNHNFTPPIHWRHNECDGVSNHQRHNCLLNRLVRRRSTKAPKLRITGHCEGNSPVTGEFPAQRASKAKIFPIWLRHRDPREKIWVRYKNTHLNDKAIVIILKYVVQIYFIRSCFTHQWLETTYFTACYFLKRDDTLGDFYGYVNTGICSWCMGQKRTRSKWHLNQFDIR